MSKFSIKKRLQSFKYAFGGIGSFLKSEHNAWIHIAGAILVISFGIWLKLSSEKWVAITFAIGLVLMAEAFNTAIEHLANSITKEKNKHIKQAKDIAAAAVLIAAITAAIIGLIIFLPPLLGKF